MMIELMHELLLWTGRLLDILKKADEMAGSCVKASHSSIVTQGLIKGDKRHKQHHRKTKYHITLDKGQKYCFDSN